KVAKELQATIPPHSHTKRPGSSLSALSLSNCFAIRCARTYNSGLQRTHGHPQPLGAGEYAVSETTRLDRESLPPSVVQRIDEACDQFEAAWRAGQQPCIEAYLGDMAEPGRSVLVLELIALEVEYRRRQGERPQAEEYLARFSQLAPQEIDRAVG